MAFHDFLIPAAQQYQELEAAENSNKQELSLYTVVLHIGRKWG
jgi:hypothetical protein